MKQAPRRSCSLTRLSAPGSFMTMHGRVRLGVTHEHVDDKRDADHSGKVVIKPLFMAQRLQRQSDGIRGAAKDRNRERIWKANADGPDPGWKQFRLDHRVDRRVAGYDHPGSCEQQE